MPFLNNCIKLILASMVEVMAIIFLNFLLKNIHVDIKNDHDLMVCVLVVLQHL